jgi:hypothetical protein
MNRMFGGYQESIKVTIEVGYGNDLHISINPGGLIKYDDPEQIMYLEFDLTPDGVWLRFFVPTSGVSGVTIDDWHKAVKLAKSLLRSKLEAYRDNIDKYLNELGEQ